MPVTLNFGIGPTLPTAGHKYGWSPLPIKYQLMGHKSAPMSPYDKMITSMAAAMAGDIDKMVVFDSMVPSTTSFGKTSGLSKLLTAAGYKEVKVDGS